MCFCIEPTGCAIIRQMCFTWQQNVYKRNFDKCCGLVFIPYFHYSDLIDIFFWSILSFWFIFLIFLVGVVWNKSAGCFCLSFSWVGPITFCWCKYGVGVITVPIGLFKGSISGASFGSSSPDPSGKKFPSRRSYWITSVQIRCKMVSESIFFLAVTLLWSAYQDIKVYR